MKELKTLTLAEAIAIVDPDSGIRAHDAATQDAVKRFLQACRIVCAAAHRAEPKSVPLTLDDLWRRAVEHKAIYVAHIDGTPMLDGQLYCAAIVDHYSGYGTIGQHVQAIYGKGLTLAEDDYDKTWIAFARKPDETDVT